MRKLRDILPASVLRRRATPEVARVQSARAASLPASARGSRNAGTGAAENPAAVGPTACVVTCHNYGRFLAQCLDSILAQSLPFAAVVVVDDASDDDTAEICERYALRGVRYFRVECRNFTAARRSGLALLPRPRFVLFVDADNWLSPEFHAALRAEMRDPRIGVVYPTKARHTEAGAWYRDDAAAFDYHALRRRNFADACSLIRFEAYEQAGGWDDNDGLTDWLLWLRVTRSGWTMKHAPAARLNYRDHGENMNRQRRAAGRDLVASVDVMRRGMVVTIVTLFSGREWMLDRFAAMLAALEWRKENLRIVAIDNANRAEFSRRLRVALESTGIPFVIIESASRVSDDLTASEFADDAPARSANNYALSEHLARLYALARENMPAATDLVWCLEDDITPPATALFDLCAGLYQHPKAAVVSGSVLSRFRNGLLAWSGSFAHPSSVPTAPASGQYMPVLASGFMCSLFRRDVWDKLVFRPSPHWDSRRHPYYDWAAAAEVARFGRDWLLSGSVRCGHWQSSGECLTLPAAVPCQCGGPCCEEHHD